MRVGVGVLFVKIVIVRFPSPLLVEHTFEQNYGGGVQYKEKFTDNLRKQYNE